MVPNSEIIDVISSKFKTKSALNAFLLELESAERASYSMTSTDRAIITDFTHTNADLFYRLGVDLENISQISQIPQLLGSIKQHILNIEPIHLTLAFEASDSFLELLQKSIKEYLGFTPLFLLRLDHSILGGTVMDYKGKHVDLSFKKLLFDYLVEHRNAIIPSI